MAIHFDICPSFPKVYRVLNGIDNVDPAKWFMVVQGREGAMSTRHTGGVMNVVRGEPNGDIRKNFWSQRVVDPWNNLPEVVKKAKTLNEFKNGLDNIRERSKGGQWLA